MLRELDTKAELYAAPGDMEVKASTTLPESTVHKAHQIHTSRASDNNSEITDAETKYPTPRNITNQYLSRRSATNHEQKNAIWLYSDVQSIAIKQQKSRCMNAAHGLILQICNRYLIAYQLNLIEKVRNQVSLNKDDENPIFRYAVILLYILLIFLRKNETYSVSLDKDDHLTKPILPGMAETPGAINSAGVIEIENQEGRIPPQPPQLW